MTQSPFAAGIPAERGSSLEVGRPHDAFLQIWVELGLIGALLAVLNGCFLVRAVSLLSHDMIAATVASIIAGTTIVSVSHGAWQGWWIGLLIAVSFWCSHQATPEA